MSERFWYFAHPESERLFVRSPPERNMYRRTPDGGYSGFEFERPFYCTVRKTQMADILWQWSTVCLISDGVLDIFHAEGLTGFDVRRADVRLMFPHNPEDAVFWQLVITGWGGIANPRSGVRAIPEKAEPGRFAYTAATNPEELIDKQNWDGSDFFMVWPFPIGRWISSRAAEVLERHKLRHYRLVPPAEKTEFAEPSRLGIGSSPQSLRHYLPEARAREIGEPLGIY